MNIDLGSFWLIKGSGCIATVKSVIAKANGGATVVYTVTDNNGVSSYRMSCEYELFTKMVDKFLTESELKDVLNKEYIKGKTDGYGEGYQHGFTLAKEKITELDDDELESIIDDAFQEGYAQAYSELHAPTTERERQLQEKAWDEGYVSAIEDYLTQGGEFISNKGCYEFRYEAGAEQFIKENMDNIKSYTRVGDVVSIELYDIDCEHTPNKKTQEVMQEVLDKNNRKHSHYFKDVRHLDYVDVYQVNKLFPVKDDTDCILHARKKLLVCGGRGGGKDMLKDVTEAYDTLKRYLEIEGQLDD